MSDYESENNNPELAIVNNLSNALFIEYGKDNNEANKTKMDNLAFDIFNIVKNNLEEDAENLLEKVKQSDGYNKLVLETDFDEQTIRGYIENLKGQVS